MFRIIYFIFCNFFKTILAFGIFFNHHVNLLFCWEEWTKCGLDCIVKVTFGTLFHDDQCANIFEALVGTLRAAKKRKVLTYEGELLLQGVHDNVEITLNPTPAAAASNWTLCTKNYKRITFIGACFISIDWNYLLLFNVI